MDYILKRSFPLEKLYLISYNKKITVGVIGVGNRIVDVFNELHDSSNTKFEIKALFLDVLKEYNLDILLTDSNGNQMQKISITKVVDLLKLLDKKQFLNQTDEKNKIISNNAANIISDLLGINISKPSTNFNFSESLGTKEIIVSARKLKLFKQFLAKYIEIHLLAEPNVIMTYSKDGQDYRIVRALKLAKIKQTEQMKENTFTLIVNKEGKLKINDLDINEYRHKQDSGFQKVFKI